MKSLKSKNRLGVSAFILLLSGVICKALGALFRLPLTNLLGIEGIGVFQLIMSLYAFALVVTCGGVTNSLSKLISTARANSNIKRVKTYLHRALFVSVGIGLIIGIVFLIFGKLIGVFQGIGENGSYSLFFILLPLGGILSALRGYFQGYENMIPTAVSQVIEQVFKFVFGIVFAFYFGKLGISQGVFGAFLGIVISEIVAVSYLFVVFLVKDKNKQKIKVISELKFARREFDSANLPLTISASILPLVNAFDGLIIVPRLMSAGLSNAVATKLFGLQAGVVGAILNFPLIISMAVTTTLLPNISYLISRGTGGKYVIEKGLKLLLFLILPTTFGVVAISRQVFSLVYNDMSGAILDAAFNLMLFGAFSIIFTALMQYLVMVLQANGQFKYILLITTLGGILKAISSFFLSAIPQINIYALVFGNLLLYSLVSLLALIKLKKIVTFSISFADLFLVLFATFSMFLTVYTFVNCNYFSPILNLILSIVLGVMVYAVMTTPFILRMRPKREKRLKCEK